MKPPEEFHVDPAKAEGFLESMRRRFACKRFRKSESLSASTSCRFV